MNQYQKQVGDIVELTDAGVAKLKDYDNNYSEVTRPVSKEERNWSAWSISNLWIGILVSVLVYQVASGLIVAGMAWYQALITILLGHTIVMGFALVFGHFGTKYGLTFPMFCIALFGTKGSIIPSILRGVIGCFWFGIQAWIGGQAINAIIGVIYPGWKEFGFTGLFISFLIFWVMNVYFAASGSNGVKRLQNYSAPFLIVLSVVVIIWAVSMVDWKLATLLAEPSLQGNPDVSFWKLFFPALSAMIAFDGAIVLSIADFTRHNKTQKAQMSGQIIGAPFMTVFIAFVGVCGTAGAAIRFNEVIWEPAILVSMFESKFIVIFFSLFIIVSILTTNVAGNLVPPTNVIATLLSKKISYRNAAILAALLAFLGLPWKALANPNALIFDVLGIVGAMLGPISGICLVAYIFQHKMNIDLMSIYRKDGGKYMYTNGWNVGLVVILGAGSLVVLISKFVDPLHIIFDNAYVFGSIGTGVAYYIYLVVTKKSGKEVEVHEGARAES